jgi:hypothetical protein
MRWPLVLSTLLLAARSRPAPPPSPDAAPSSSSNALAMPASTASGSSQRVALSPAIATAIENVKALIVEPDDKTIERSMSPYFLQHVPREKVRAVFTRVGRKVGACGRVEVVEVNRGKAVVKLFCDNGVVTAQITARTSPPYLMDGLVVRTKPR